MRQVQLGPPARASERCSVEGSAESSSSNSLARTREKCRPRGFIRNRAPLRETATLRWLETAIGLGNENYRWFESDPNWTDLHEDPRFVELMNRIKSQREHSGNQTE